MIEYCLNTTDSALFGRNVVDIKVSGDCRTDYHLMENEIIKQWDPILINVFLPVDNLKAISWFTGNLYQFVENRIHAVKVIDEYFSTRDLFPYEFYRVNDNQELDNLLSVCAEMSFDDRYSCDPEIDKKFALKRNVFFLRQSFERDNEPVFILNNRYHPGILGFRSFRLETKVEATMLLSGVINHPMREKYLSMINLFELEKLAELEIRYINTVISTRNYSEFNHYISKFNYAVDKVQFVCRKFLC